MECILIHRSKGLMPPEILKALTALTKNILAKPEELVPGGKPIAAYAARCEGLAVCIWDVPNVENLVPVFEQMSNLGIDTQIIPADKMEVAVSKWEKALAEMAK